MLAGLLLLAAAAYPPLREAAVEGARSAWEAVFPIPWTGYYLEIDAADLAQGMDVEDATVRLMFAGGTLPGMATRLLEEGAWTGTWSPSGDRFVAGSGTRLFVGDRHGLLHEIVDLHDLVPTGPALWASDRELLVPVTRDGAMQWLLRLDARSGAAMDQRAFPAELEAYAISADAGWLLAVDHDRSAGVLYEPATGRRVEPGRAEAFVAWLADGRILVSTVDDEGAHLVARSVEGARSEVLADLDGIPLLPAVTNGPRVALVELERGEASGPRTIWLLALGQTPVRVATGLGAVYFPTPSRDGRYVSFSELERRSDADVRLRTGVIEVATKHVTYACDSGCSVLDLR